jgi:hypothetical protein
MVWRIKGLSQNFVYFNDDTFLVKRLKSNDWFIKDEPVMRGAWVPAPGYRTLWNRFLILVNKYLLGKAGYKPRASFKLGQWNSASLLGFKYRYFKGSHTPHAVSRKTAEDFFNKNESLIEKNISYRFRESGQFTFVALSNHLQLLAGNKKTSKPDLIYLQPYNRSKGYIEKKIKLCENNPEIKFMCVQSLELCSKVEQDKVFGWLDKIMETDH